MPTLVLVSQFARFTPKMGLDKNRSDVESVLDQTNFTAHHAKLPGTDQMVVQERLHQKAQMPSF